MKKLFKWLAILFCAMVVLVVAALLIVPKFVDIQQYKSILADTVQEKTGRSFAMDGDLELSLFPWAGVTLKGIALGNPDGFQEEGFVSFSEFEIRMKLFPLLSKKIEVKHIVLKGLRMVLEKNEEGEVNWNFSTNEAPAAAVENEPEPDQDTSTAGEAGSLPIETLAVGEISVTDGSVIYIDRQADTRKELTDVNIIFSEISFDSPLKIDISGKLDGKEFSLAGNVGPLGSRPGEEDIDFELIAKGFDMVEVGLSGSIEAPSTAPTFALKMSIGEFSPKALLKVLAPEVDFGASDPTVFEKFSFQADLSGDASRVELSGGKIVLDDTTTTMEVIAKDFDKPDIKWDLHVDAIDIDRYLPEPPTDSSGVEERGSAQEGPTASALATDAEPMDYSPLRSLVLDGVVAVDELRAGGGVFENIEIKTSANGGKIVLAPFTVDLYEGNILVRSTVDVTGDTPETSMQLKADGVEIEPLLKDFIEKDFISGTTVADITLSMTGDGPEEIKQSLDGNGDIRFQDGKIQNVNLLGMVQNLQTAFGSGGGIISDETDFSEFRSLFTIADGVLNTTDTEISSPVMRVNVTGEADIVGETLDFRVEPTYINPQNQKESGMSISGNEVPVLVTGTFAEPKFKPDLETAAKNVVTEKITETITEKLGDVLGGGNEDEDDSGTSSTVEDAVKGLINNLPF